MPGRKNERVELRFLKKLPSKCRGKRSGKKHKKTGSGSRGNKKTQLEKRGLKKGGMSGDIDRKGVWAGVVKIIESAVKWSNLKII